MKQKWIRSDTPLRPYRKVSIVIFFLSIAVMLTSCFLKQDRTTAVYGTITDQNGLPVDSILVLASGLQFLNYEDLKQVYSNKEGKYELVIEVPKKFHAVDVIIPTFPTKNPKYLKNYNGYEIRKNDAATNNCCTASVGEKTKYDFQLIPK